MVLDRSIKMAGANCWAEGKRQDFCVPTGRLRDTKRVKEISPCFGRRKGDQPYGISGGATIGLFTRQIMNTTKQRQVCVVEQGEGNWDTKVRGD